MLLTSDSNFDQLDNTNSMHQAAIEHLTKADKVLARLIRKVGPCELKARKGCSPFQALVQSVAHQQLNGIAANTILKRVMALYPRRRFPTPDDVLATPDEKLRGAGLSRAKVAAIKDIAAKTVEGVVPPSRVIAKMPDAEILERLTTIRGVGPWTVEMLLIFKLGRLEEAEGILNKALQGANLFPGTYEHLGDVYNQQGKRELAIGLWQKALSLANDPKDSSRLKAKLSGEPPKEK